MTSIAPRDVSRFIYAHWRADRSPWLRWALPVWDQLSSDERARLDGAALHTLRQVDNAPG